MKRAYMFLVRNGLGFPCGIAIGMLYLLVSCLVCEWSYVPPPPLLRPPDVPNCDDVQLRNSIHSIRGWSRPLTESEIQAAVSESLSHINLCKQIGGGPPTNLAPSKE
jgi:hypothetical protein